MQSDYISRQDAIDVILRGGITYHEELIDIWEIERIPAADVAPVVHGQWIRGKYTDDDLRHNDYSYRCNRCGKIVDFEENYCPDCGAKMDGGKS